MSKRARLGSIVLACVFLFTVGCGGDSTPQVAEEDGTKTQSQAQESREKEFPKSPKVEAVWQNAVVDVEATSRYRDPKGGSDSATVTVNLLLAEDATDEFKDFLDDQDVDWSVSEEDPRLVRLIYRITVEEVTDEDVPEGADRYRVNFEAPLDFITIKKDGDVSLTVLLPRPSIDYRDKVPLYDVRFVETVGAPEGEQIGVDEPSQREAVFFYARVDDAWGVIYELIDDVNPG